MTKHKINLENDKFLDFVVSLPEVQKSVPSTPSYNLYLKDPLHFYKIFLFPQAFHMEFLPIGERTLEQLR